MMRNSEKLRGSLIKIHELRQEAGQGLGLLAMAVLATCAVVAVVTRRTQIAGEASEASAAAAPAGSQDPIVAVAPVVAGAPSTARTH